MKFLLALVISMALALGTSPLLFTEEAPPEGTVLTEEERTVLNRHEPFSLETKESDSPEAARFKAALRLLNAYTITINQMRGCAASDQKDIAQLTLANFHRRNGTIMGRIMRLIKQNGDLTPEIREELDERAAELIWADPRRGNCQAQIAHVADGGEDLYKALKYAEDYKLLRADDN